MDLFSIVLITLNTSLLGTFRLVAMQIEARVRGYHGVKLMLFHRLSSFKSRFKAIDNLDQMKQLSSAGLIWSCL